jgi:hypothetical protein
MGLGAWGCACDLAGFFPSADFKVAALRTSAFDGLRDAGEAVDGTDDAGAAAPCSSVFVGFAVPFERPCGSSNLGGDDGPEGMAPPCWSPSAELPVERPCGILNVSNVMAGGLVWASALVCDGVALVWLWLDPVV